MRKLVVLGALNLVVLMMGVAAAIAAPTRERVGPYSERLWGNDRYETSVAISQSQWNDQNTTTVFLASGLSFPDALALSASTNKEGPILLTLPDELPEVVGAEINRLQPCRIIAVGGARVISDVVIRNAEARTQRQGCP